MKNVSNEQLGRVIYKITLGLAVILILIGFFLKSENKEIVVMTRYVISFYVFSLILPAGIITNEIMSGKYDKKKIQIKIIIASILVIVGSILFLVAWEFNVVKFSMFASLLALALIMVKPTIPPTRR